MLLDEIKIKPNIDILFYVLVQLLIYHASAFFVVDTGSGIFILLFVLPIATAVIALVYGYRHGIHLLYPMLTAFTFSTVIVLHYNESACIYVFAYGLIALIAMVLGRILKKLWIITQNKLK